MCLKIHSRSLFEVILPVCFYVCKAAILELLTFGIYLKPLGYLFCYSKRVRPVLTYCPEITEANNDKKFKKRSKKISTHR